MCSMQCNQVIRSDNEFAPAAILFSRSCLLRSGRLAILCMFRVTPGCSCIGCPTAIKQALQMTGHVLMPPLCNMGGQRTLDAIIYLSEMHGLRARFCCTVASANAVQTCSHADWGSFLYQACLKHTRQMICLDAYSPEHDIETVEFFFGLQELALAGYHHHLLVATSHGSNKCMPRTIWAKLLGITAIRGSSEMLQKHITHRPMCDECRPAWRLNVHPLADSLGDNDFGFKFNLLRCRPSRNVGR